jgi:hypothetical protein
MKEAESITRAKELERQLKIVRAVTDHTVKLSGGSVPNTAASPQAAPAVAAVG